MIGTICQQCGSKLIPTGMVAPYPTTRKCNCWLKNDTCFCEPDKPDEK